MENTLEVIDVLASLSLFGDLARPQLEAVAHTFDEAAFGDGERILRQGFAGSGFYVIIDGEAAVRIDGHDRGKLSRGDFFGEISILLGEMPSADIVALTSLRCLVLGGSDLRDFLVAYPMVAYRMLQTEVRRLRAANQWQS
jgi:CRP-like cAMP-binding protein